MPSSGTLVARPSEGSMTASADCPGSGTMHSIQSRVDSSSTRMSGPEDGRSSNGTTRIPRSNKPHARYISQYRCCIPRNARSRAVDSVADSRAPTAARNSSRKRWSANGRNLGQSSSTCSTAPHSSGPSAASAVVRSVNSSVSSECMAGTPLLSHGFPREDMQRASRHRLNLMSIRGRSERESRTAGSNTGPLMLRARSPATPRKRACGRARPAGRGGASPASRGRIVG